MNASRVSGKRSPAQLDYEWTLSELARVAHVSGEHLRRLCTQQLGRTPMRQVTYLRMRRAAELLSTTDEKIESITHAVGYQNPFVFSNTFKKWIGWRRAYTARAGPAALSVCTAGRFSKWLLTLIL